MSIQFQKPDYIIVFVSDMQRSTAFYRDTLGLPLKFTSPGWTEFNTEAITIALHMTGGETSAQKQSLPPPGNAHIAFMGVGLQSAYKELHPAAELAEAVAADERESAGGEEKGAPARKKQDPQMRVYLRLQADAKWYDTSEEDIRTWFRQLAPDGYERNKNNAEHTIKKLQYLVSLIEEAQGRE